VSRGESSVAKPPPTRLGPPASSRPSGHLCAEGEAKGRPEGPGRDMGTCSCPTPN
jgi:hypothetical protein